MMTTPAVVDAAVMLPPASGGERPSLRARFAAMAGAPAREPRTRVVDIVAPHGHGLTLTSKPCVLVRWLVVGVGTVAAARSAGHLLDVAMGLPLIALAVLRSAQLRWPGPAWLRALWPGLATESVVVLGVVAVTGSWRSPWSIALMAQAAVVGAFVPSRRAGSAAAAGLIVFLCASVLLRPEFDEHGWLASAALLAVIGLTVAYASWVFARAERHRALLAEANERLAATNALLVGLDRASPRDGEDFDPRRCARSIAATSRLVLEAETVAVLAVTALPDRWQVLHAEGAHLATVVDDISVPSLRCLAPGPAGDVPTEPRRTAFAADIVPLNPASSSGLVIPLHMHGRHVGALLLEHSADDRWGDTDGSIITNLAERAALMLDNARRFNALWVVGATEERTRVAHDLHDHLGQSMAALGLELDVLARRVDDEDTRLVLRDLRSRVTFMVADLRGTMKDLRCDVSEKRDLTDVLGSVVRDLNGRCASEVVFDADGGGRLPLAQEHQLLLIARQALTTAVMDTGARRVLVRWVCDGDAGLLEVSHDGGDAAQRSCAPGLSEANLDALEGIEDRCRAIGAQFSTDPAGSIKCEVLR